MRANLPHVGVLLRMGEATRQHAARLRVDLNLPCGRHARLFKAKIKPADTCKQ
jgi:hypothetical protein